MIFTISIVSATTLAVRVAYDTDCNPVHNDVALRYSSILKECEISCIFRRHLGCWGVCVCLIFTISPISWPPVTSIAVWEAYGIESAQIHTYFAAAPGTVKYLFIGGRKHLVGLHAQMEVQLCACSLTAARAVTVGHAYLYVMTVNVCPVSDLYSDTR